MTVNTLLTRSYMLVGTLRLCLCSRTCVCSIVTTELVQASQHVFCGKTWVPPLGGWFLTEKMMHRKWKKLTKANKIHGNGSGYKEKYWNHHDMCRLSQKDQSEVARALSIKARGKHSVHSKHKVKAAFKLYSRTKVTQDWGGENAVVNINEGQTWMKVINVCIQLCMKSLKMWVINCWFMFFFIFSV